MAAKDIIFGTRAVIEAVDSGKEIEKIFIKKGISNELTKELLAKLKNTQIPFQFVPVEKLNRISRKNHQGVIAFQSPIKYYEAEEIVTRCFEEGKNPLILILDGVTDIRNFGAIARTAECVGVDAIVIPSKGSAQINADAIKTSAGALHKIPVCRSMDFKKTIKNIKNSGLEIYAATEKSDTLYTKLDYKNPAAIILGAEDKGISEDLISIADFHIKIPIFGSIKSLNVSVAAGVILYEVIKHRNN